MSAPIITTQSVFAQGDTNPYAKVGELAVNVYGDRFRYVLVGVTALVTAELIQEPAEDTLFVSMAVPAIVAIGATAITVTNGTTAVTANMFNDGFLTISTSTGIGQSFRIMSHTTGVSGASITYYLSRPLITALSVTSKVSVRKSPYAGVIEFPATTQTGGPVGFARIANTAATYGWIQSGGDTPVLFDNADNTSNGVIGIHPSLSVAGSVCAAAAADVAPTFLGYSHQVASVDSTVSMAHIILD